MQFNEIEFYLSVEGPTAVEVCESYGLQDVEIDYNEEEYQNINYKQFQQLVRPIIQKENPKVRN